MTGGKRDPKKGSNLLCRRVKVRYKFIKSNRNNFKIRTLCRVLKVSKSGYYSWLKNPMSNREKSNTILLSKIRAIFEKKKKRYGSYKIYKELRGAGVFCGKNRVAAIMRKNKLFSKVKKKFKATTHSSHKLPVSENILDRNFCVERKNTHWVGDISYVNTKEGWLYLATVIDLYSRAVVGFATRNSMTTELIEDAFIKAANKRKPESGLIFHSDRGSQYASKSFQKLLEINHAISSMSRKGNCWDNAVAESFFKIIKSELIYHCEYTSRKEAHDSIFEYIEAFYNSQRIHGSINYMTPMQFEMAA